MHSTYISRDALFVLVDVRERETSHVADFQQVTFDRMHFCQLDVMIHVAVSAIRYHWISFGMLPARVSSTRYSPAPRPKGPTVVVELKAGCNRGESGSVSDNRSEERRVGKEGVRTCRSRW